ncbi:MAG: DUF1569 domain-containing protein [Planctomycetota bacterium]|nr:DUF1569 domain-containing protein [Planctomycetota bacterium]
MSVNTKTVAGRRKLRFNSFDDLRAEAERLAGSEVKMLGNWSLAQIFKHLAEGLNSTIDGSSFKPPLFVRLVAGVFMKKKFIYKEIPSGFAIPKDAQAQFLPKEDIETEAALTELQAAIERVKSTDKRAQHPVFGKVTREEANNFQLRHAEMHLSFAVPIDSHRTD